MSTDQTTILRLGPDDHGRPVTADDFASAEFVAPYRYERVAGRLEVMSPAGHHHQAAAFPWENRLHVHAAARPDVVEFIFGQAWVGIPGASDRVGDIGVFLHGERSGLEIPARVPELMFEIVSPSPADRRRDYVEKRAEYHAAKVLEYVVVDRFQKQATVLTWTEAGYEERVLTEADVYETPLLPGLAVALGDVF